MKNIVIREKAKNAGVRLWEVAEHLGIGDATLSRKLRHELPREDRDRILEIIDEIANEKEVS